MSQHGGQQGREPNRLIHESSPYLLQHADNPVDWHAWNPAALARAKAENRPILLSIGYSACHWCHVMERECFENEAIAELMNRDFVSIKVDREERPDLDDIYQKAAQFLSGQGGWPLTVFLTPDLRPFYAGTYFPPEDRFGRPGFPRVLETLHRVFTEEPDKVERAASQLTQALSRLGNALEGDKEASPELVARAQAQLWAEIDWENGGFGSQPKFPNTPGLELLLRAAAPLAAIEPALDAARAPLAPAARPEAPTPAGALAAVSWTLWRMAAGGIYDQLGGGFHRYSVDAHWSVPHFEKMLYDNALLTPLYVKAFLLTREPRFEQVVRETLAYVEREMTHPEGGFYATQDADSEGEEGKFFVWRPEEVRAVVGEAHGALLCEHFGVTEDGNFEDGATVLSVAVPVEELARRHGGPNGVAEVARAIAEGKERLLAARSGRVPPFRDEKVITAWNGLMISAFAQAAAALAEPRWAQIAARAAAFLERESVTPTGRLRRHFKDGPVDVPGFLEDYAFLAQGLLDLYEATFEPRCLESAVHWMTQACELFWDDAAGGFFTTPHDHEALIHRPKDVFDESIPSGNAVAASNLIRLAAVADGEPFLERAEELFAAFTGHLRHGWGAAALIGAYDLLAHGMADVVVARSSADGGLPLLRPLLARYRPYLNVYAIGPKAPHRFTPGLWHEKHPIDGRAAAYVCQDFRCSAPVSDWERLATLLE